MKLFAKLAALFSAPPAPVAPPPPLYSDAEFLEVVMQHARQKNRGEQVARADATAVHGPSQPAGRE